MPALITYLPLVQFAAFFAGWLTAIITGLLMTKVAK